MHWNAEFWGMVLQMWALAYVPGIVLCLAAWLILRRSAPMQIYFVDWGGLIWPFVIWFALVIPGWTPYAKSLSNLIELLILGWTWGILFLARLIVPRLTHKIRFRLAAIHVGTLVTLLALILALCVPGLPE